MRLWARAALAAAVGTVARPARADATAPPAYALRLDADLAALALAGAVSSAWLLQDSLAGPACAPLCDRSELPRIDRFAAGNWDTGWRTASDAGVATVLVGSAATLLATEGLANGANDLVVVAQAQLFSNAVAVLSNMGTRRPRPFVYGDAAPLDERKSGGASLSFFSGHTAGCVAVTTSTFLTLRRLDRRGLAWLYLALGGATSAMVGVSRVAAGDHFPTDVLVGAVAGGANGVLFPALHDAPVRLAPSAGGAPGLGLAGAF
jgi:membrane-associated phospholipid phosphatase